MASNLKISTTARNALVDALTTLIDVGTGGGRVEIRAGAPPTNVSDASSGGSPLATLTLQDPSYAAASGGTATVNAITPVTASASGDAGYFRIYANGAADTAAILQGTAGEAADTPDLEFDEKSIVSGGTVTITALSITMPIQ